MEIYKSTEERYFCLLKGSLYRLALPNSIHKWPSSESKKLLESPLISPNTSPPKEVIDQFENLKVKLILGIPYEDI